MQKPYSHSDLSEGLAILHSISNGKWIYLFPFSRQKTYLLSLLSTDKIYPAFLEFFLSLVGFKKHHMFKSYTNECIEATIIANFLFGKGTERDELAINPVIYASLNKHPPCLWAQRLSCGATIQSWRDYEIGAHPIKISLYELNL